MRSGAIYLDAAALDYASLRGYGWSQQAHSGSPYALYFVFRASDVGFSSAHRWHAFPGLAYTMSFASPELSYVRSGIIRLSASILYTAGRYGYNWSNQAYSSGSIYAYYLYFFIPGASPSHYGDDRWSAFPVLFNI